MPNTRDQSNVGTVVNIFSGALFLCLHFGALAQFDAADSYMNDIQPIEIDGKFEPMGEGLAGDSIEHDRGTLSFYHVDVDIPGNSNLPVRFARSYTIHGTAYTGNHLGGWQIDVPFIVPRSLRNA